MDFHLVLKADVAAHVALQLLNDFFVLLLGSPHEFRVLVAAYPRPRALLGFHHCLDSVLHTLLDEVVGLNGHGRNAHLAALAVLLKHVPVVELLLQVFDLQVHYDLDRSTYVLQHLEPADFLELELLVFEDVVGDLVQLGDKDREGQTGKHLGDYCAHSGLPLPLI